MTRKLYEIAFEIGGKLQSSLRTSVMTAAGQLETLDRRLKDLDARKLHGPGFDAYNAKIDTTIQKLKGLKTQLREVEGAIQANQANRANLRGQMVDTAVMALALAAPIKAAASFETAMLGVAKQVKGARDEGGNLTAVYFDMAKQIQMMGREIPIATNEIAEMVAAGARMGVAREQLLKFTETSAMMASAFELPSGELAEQMGKIAGLYKIPIPAISELGDTINWLDDNAIAKGGDIIEFLTRVGGVAGAVKISGQQVAALGSTLLTLGERTDTASTAANAMIQKFAAADKGTAKFQAAIAELGLSTAKIQKSMQMDATGTILEVLDKLSTMPKDQQLGIMVDLMGLEHSDTIVKLANNTAEFRKQLEMAASAEAKGSMSREFQSQRKTTNAQLQIMKNNVTELGVSFGTLLLPGVNAVFSALAKITQPMAEFARKNPVLTKTIVGVAVGFAGLKIALLALRYAGTFVIGGFLAMRKVLVMLRVGTILMTSAQWLFNLALSASPIGIAIKLVAALVAVGVLLYTNWGKISEVAKKVWTGVADGVRNTIDSVKKFLASIDLAAIGSAIMTSLINGIKAKAAAVVDSIKETFAGVQKYMPFAGSKIAPFRQRQSLGSVQPSSNMGAAIAGGGIGQKSMSLKTSTGNMSVTFSPQITLPPGSPEQTRQAVDRSMSAGLKDFEKKMAEMMHQKGRTSYA